MARSKRKGRLRRDQIAKIGWDVLKRDAGKQTSGFWFGKITPTGTFIGNDFSGCHADLRGWSNNSAIYTFVPSFKQDSESAKAYITWLAKSSPWRMAGVIPKTSPSFAMKHGFLITDMKLPANLVANFCFATRQANEHPHIIDFWHLLCKAGVHPSLAFVFANAVRGQSFWVYGNSGHDALDADMSTAAVWNFCHARFGTPLQPIGKSGEYQPCCAGWEPMFEAAGDEGEQYQTFLQKKYPVVKPEEDRRMFRVNDNARAGFARTNEEWIAMALKETKRICHDLKAA